jgi:hypothetical protein
MNIPYAGRSWAARHQRPPPCDGPGETEPLVGCSAACATTRLPEQTRPLSSSNSEPQRDQELLHLHRWRDWKMNTTTKSYPFTTTELANPFRTLPQTLHRTTSLSSSDNLQSCLP